MLFRHLLEAYKALSNSERESVRNQLSNFLASGILHNDDYVILLVTDADSQRYVLVHCKEKYNGFEYKKTISDSVFEKYAAKYGIKVNNPIDLNIIDKILRVKKVKKF